MISGQPQKCMAPRYPTLMMTVLTKPWKPMKSLNDAIITESCLQSVDRVREPPSVRRGVPRHGHQARASKLHIACLNLIYRIT